jgi:hypothetical protein
VSKGFCVRWVIASVAVCFAWSLTTALPAAQAPPEDDLPPGEGRKILLASCTSCHELNEVTKFKGYYTRPQWRDIVVTMMEYGAPIEQPQVEILADYLTEHFGRKDTP